MGTIDINGPHRFQNENNFESEDRKGKFMWMVCPQCGIRGKRRGHGDVLEISRPYTIKRASNCAGIPEKRPNEIEIVDASGLSEWGFENGKRYKVVDAPGTCKGMEKKAIWVQAPELRVQGDLVAETVMLLEHEFKYIEQ